MCVLAFVWCQQRLTSSGFVVVCFCLLVFLSLSLHCSSVRGLLVSQLQGTFHPSFPRTTVSGSSPHNGAWGLNSGPHACPVNVSPAELAPQLLKTTFFVLSVKRIWTGAMVLEGSCSFKSHYLVSFPFRLISLRFLDAFIYMAHRMCCHSRVEANIQRKGVIKRPAVSKSLNAQP